MESTTSTLLHTWYVKDNTQNLVLTQVKIETGSILFQKLVGRDSFVYYQLIFLKEVSNLSRFLSFRSGPFSVRYSTQISLFTSRSRSPQVTHHSLPTILTLNLRKCKLLPTYTVFPI